MMINYIFDENWLLRAKKKKNNVWRKKKLIKKKSFWIINKKGFRVEYIYIGRITNYCETYKKLL